METPLALAQGAMGPALASYTGALLADTAVPTWAASRDHLSYLFVSSASLATGGAAMLPTPAVEAGPARLQPAAGGLGDVVAMRTMKEPLHQLAPEPLDTG